MNTFEVNYYFAFSEYAALIFSVLMLNVMNIRNIRELR